jgi:hypothetical protein
MHITLIGFIAITAFVATVIGAFRAPLLWVGVVLLCIIELLRVFPLG